MGSSIQLILLKMMSSQSHYSVENGLRLIFRVEWWDWPDLNQRPPHLQCGALPTELQSP